VPFICELYYNSAFLAREEGCKASQIAMHQYIAVLWSVLRK